MRSLGTYLSWIPPIFAFTFLTAPLTLLDGYSNILDALTRLNANDPFVGSYYFWWTNLTYLPAFFFWLVLYYWMQSHFALNLTSTVVIFFYALTYSTEVVDFVPLTYLNSSTFYTNFGSNQLLSNALNKYHPLVLYLSFIVFFSFAWRYLNLHMNGKTFNVVMSQGSLKGVWYAIVINFVALWMGSWWALQEGTWGGWWNWDASEMFGLMVSLALLSLMHSETTPSSHYLLVMKSIFFVVAIVASYFFMQLNFELVSHNFGSKFFFFFNNNLFFLEVIILTFGIMAWIWTKVCLWSTIDSSLTYTSIRNNVTDIRMFITMLPLLVATLWVIFSYSPLVNYYLWNFFEVNSFNFETSFQPLSFLSFFLLFSFVRIASFRDLSYWALPAVFITNWLWIFIILPFHAVRFSKLHFVLIVFTILNVSLSDSTLFYWTTMSEYLYVPFASALEYPSLDYYIPDSGITEYVETWSSYNYLTSTTWNIYTFSNSLAINSFSLELSHSILRNLYQLGGCYSSVFLDLEIPLLSFLNLLFLIFIFL